MAFSCGKKQTNRFKSSHNRKKGNTFLNQSSSRVRSFYCAHGDQFRAIIFSHSSRFSELSPSKRRKQTFWIILDTRSRTISSSRPNRLEQNLPYQNKRISFHTALPLFAKSKAYPMCKRETRNTYHNQSVKNLPIKIPHRFLTHVEKSDFDTNEQNLAVTMSPCSLVRV